MSVVHAESELLRAAGPAADRPVARPSRARRLLSLRPLPAAALACRAAGRRHRRGDAAGLR